MAALDRTVACGRRRAPAALVLLALGAGCVSGAALGRPTALAACAAHDLHVLMLIDDRSEEDGPDIASIVSAATTLVAARVACREGRTELAFELYDRATLEEPRRRTADRRLGRP